MKNIIDYSSFTANYPPATMFQGSNNEKAEKRIVKCCEEVYSLTFSDLRDFRSAVREFDLISRMNTTFPVKRTELLKAFAAVVVYGKQAHTHLMALAKKDQLLQAYFAPITMNNKDFRDMTDRWLSEICVCDACDWKQIEEFCKNIQKEIDDRKKLK